MTFRGLLWFCCNEMPLFGGDKGDWVYKRICIMKALGRVYDKNDKIPEDETNIVYRNEHLIDELWEEREYIVSRAIEALYKYIDNGEKWQRNRRRRKLQSGMIKKNNNMKRK